MSTGLRHWLDSDKFGWIEFAGTGNRGVVLDSATLAGLRAAIDELRQKAAVAVIVVSADPAGFSSGPDIAWLASLRDPAGASEYSRKGQRLLDALESIGVPTVCALHGSCLGPGLELALACHSRIATNEPRLRLGFGPTGSLMTPAWGGCVRLPPLVGAEEALERLISAEAIDAQEAFSRGYVDEVVPAARLRDAAKALAGHAARLGAPVRLGPQPAAPGVFGRMREKAKVKSGARRTAGFFAIDVVERTLGMHKKAAMEIETHAFGQLTLEPVWRKDVCAAAADSV